MLIGESGTKCRGYKCLKCELQFKYFTLAKKHHTEHEFTRLAPVRELFKKAEIERQSYESSGLFCFPFSLSSPEGGISLPLSLDFSFLASFARGAREANWDCLKRSRRTSSRVRQMATSRWEWEEARPWIALSKSVGRRRL